MFGYKALGEMTTVGKALTQAFYGVASDAKIYTYYEGCSDGGREGWSQVQRWGEEYDGVIVGAPAFRYAQQQIVSRLSQPIVSSCSPKYQVANMSFTESLDFKCY